MPLSPWPSLRRSRKSSPTIAEVERRVAAWEEVADELEALADQLDPEHLGAALPDIMLTVDLPDDDPRRLRTAAGFYRRLADETREDLAQWRDLAASLAAHTGA